MRHQQKTQKLKSEGFSLTELMVAVTFVGILASLALPKYLNQVNRSRQGETASTVAQIQTTIASYADEFGVLPTSWSELNAIGALMTDDGPATSDSFDEPITLTGGYYDVIITNTDNLFTIAATRSDEPNLDVIACINLTNGASDINQGTFESAAPTPDCG